MNAIDTTCTGARKRHDQSLIGQLNLEWARLRTEPESTRSLARWARTQPALRGLATLGEVEDRVATSARPASDAVLLALVELAHAGEQLAGRVVLQLMLGKAVRIAASHTGRAERDLLEQLAVAALWDAIATYPVARRRRKVAANLAMETLHRVVAELAHDRHETPTEPSVLTATGKETDHGHRVVDLELFEVLAWGVDSGAVSPADAALLARVYCGGPDTPGGAAAAAEFGLTWVAARQRCSRAVHRLAAAVQADHDAVAAA